MKDCDLMDLDKKVSSAQNLDHILTCDAAIQELVTLLLSRQPTDEILPLFETEVFTDNCPVYHVIGLQGARICLLNESGTRVEAYLDDASLAYYTRDFYRFNLEHRLRNRQRLAIRMTTATLAVSRQRW